MQREAGAQRSARYEERLTSASEALGAEPLRRRAADGRAGPSRPARRRAGHEIVGQAFYAMGQWRKAIAELELARQLDGSLVHHPVLADCYRALKRYDKVDELWRELKEASPEPALMAEGRIIAAGALRRSG